MTDAPRLARRGVLTLAALAALPAACSRPGTAPAGPAAAPIFGPPSTAAPVMPLPSSAPSASKSATPKPSASATPEETAKAKAASRGGGPVPALSGQAMLGSYLDLSGRSLRQSLSLRRDQLGREQRIVHLFHGWAERMPTSVPEIGRSTLMISWHGTAIASVNNGSQDGRITAAAKNLARYGKPMLLRWAWEMNGNWFEWDGSHNGDDPGAYARAYRRIHKIFRDNGADNVAFVWSPNWNSAPDVSWNQMERYYPGDAYVDWAGVSAYNFDGESPGTLLKHIVSVYGKRKPVMLTETAAIEHGGRSKAEWIEAMSAYVRRTPAVSALVWFDTDVQHDSDHNFRFDSTEASLAAYRKMARSSRFSA
jgi:hypothetical protein